MPADELNQILSESAGEVLETMFFTSVLGETFEKPGAAGWISATLSFRGSPSGRFGVRVPPDSARRIAAGFLGLEEEEVSAAQTGEVVCELCNMLCGSVLSRLEKDSLFELSHPEIDLAGVGCPEVHTACRLLELEDGVLGAWLALER